MRTIRLREEVSLCTLLTGLAVAFITTGIAENVLGKTIYVNNIGGSDSYDGSCAVISKLPAGPVATLDKAVKLLGLSDTLEIANTGKPYRASLQLYRKGGTPSAPMIIEGNNAILEGLVVVEPNQWTIEKDGLLSIPWTHFRGFAVWIDEQIPHHTVEVKGKPSLNDIKPGCSVWSSDGKRGYFRMPQGRKISELKLEIPNPQSLNGVAVIECGFITIRNIHVRYFADDGFNETGECNGLVFQNIEASYNGDQGMSAHNAVSAVIFNAYFHHNKDGIIDCQYSQTFYYGLRIHDNWAYAVWFLGGYHLLTDAQIWDNADGVTFEPLGDTNSYGTEHNVLYEARGRLYNVYVRNCKLSGLNLKGGSNVTVEHATITGNERNIVIGNKNAQLHMINSIIADANVCEIEITGNGYFGGYNVWAKGSMQVNGKPDTIQHWTAGKGMEEHSVFGNPRLAGGIIAELDVNSPARNKAFMVEWNRSYLASLKADPNTCALRYKQADIGASFVDQ